MKIVYRYRVKDKHSAVLARLARGVNLAWNFCNEQQKLEYEVETVARMCGGEYKPRFFTGFDFNKATVGMAARLGIYSGTLNAVCEQYARSRKQHKKRSLRWRGKRSLGWVPMKGRDLKRTETGFRFFGHHYTVWYSRPIPEGAKVCDGTCFAQDAEGRWYLNICLELPDVAKRDGDSVGIDLGLKALATLSDGTEIENPRIFRKYEAQLAVAQRARKAGRVKAIHAKIGNARQDFLHKATTDIARRFAYIGVGNVSAAKLAKTKMAKSVLDASWATFRQMLAYKAMTHGGTYAEVDERLTTQTCSNCGALPESRPRGIAGLGIRHWVCSECGCEHGRDVNAALNILARSGHRPLAEGIPVL